LPLERRFVVMEAEGLWMPPPPPLTDLFAIFFFTQTKLEQNTIQVI
jgi:hypothetical protein